MISSGSSRGHVDGSINMMEDFPATTVHFLSCLLYLYKILNMENITEFEELLKECSSKHFKGIEYFSRDGSSMPNAIGSYRGWFLHECKINSEAFVLDEAVHDKQYGLADYRGGIIVFSTEVNAVQLDRSRIKNWIKQHIRSFVQKYNSGGILHKVVHSFNKHNDSEDYIGGYSVGNAFKGVYVGDNGEKYNEESTTIEVNGLSSEGLLRLAEMIARVFKQETVLVKDFNVNKFYYANDLRNGDVPDFNEINKKSN